MQKIALIPAYQPDSRMLPLVKKVKRLDFTVVVVDDGSGADYDDAFESAKEYADVLRYVPNRGKGEALKHGLRYIQEHFSPPYTVVTADSDGQHRLEDIVKVSRIAAENPKSLILGKRPLDKSTPIKSRIGNGITRVLYRLTTGRKVYETQTGLRAFSDTMIDRFLKLPGSRYEFEIDMMLISSDIDIIETEIRTVYFDNNAATHFRPIADTVALNKEFILYKLPSIFSGCVDYLLFMALTGLTNLLLVSNIGARILSLALKFLLNRTVFFAEKAPIGQYLITSAAVIVLDTLCLWGLYAAGMNPYYAKLLSGILMIFVSIFLRMLFVKLNHK